MIDQNEADKLIETLISLRLKYKESSSAIDLKNLKKHESLCTEKFSYIIAIHTSKYKNFSNYEDLKQEGHIALISALSNFNPKKGSIFFWCHKYISTKISRSANLHTTIRYPLKVAKEVIPHRESALPLMIELDRCPDKEYELAEITNLIETKMNLLSHDEKMVINLTYGFDGSKPMSINKVCKCLGISRSICLKLLTSSLETLKQNIIL